MLNQRQLLFVRSSLGSGANEPSGFKITTVDQIRQLGVISMVPESPLLAFVPAVFEFLKPCSYNITEEPDNSLLFQVHRSTQMLSYHYLMNDAVGELLAEVTRLPGRALAYGLFDRYKKLVAVRRDCTYTELKLHSPERDYLLLQGTITSEGHRLISLGEDVQGQPILAMCLLGFAIVHYLLMPSSSHDMTQDHQ